MRLSLLQFLGIDGIEEQYRAWLAVYFYVVVYRYINGDNEFGIFRGLKRGDDRYSYLICKKFNQLGRFGKNLSYFGFGSHEAVSGSGLLVTLEYNSNQISVGDAWNNVGTDLNRWICGFADFS